MEHFLAERYVPPSGKQALAGELERIRSAARSVPAIRLVESVYVPGDELCLYLFESDSAETVALLSRVAELEMERIRRAEVGR